MPSSMPAAGLAARIADSWPLAYLRLTVRVTGMLCEIPPLEPVTSGPSLLRRLLWMREMEDARSLAGLAREVYSDRISVDQQEQERLRFSADDIVKLPIHRAINLWVAGGTPRSGFIAHTLPMEPLHDQRLATHHRDAQRARGGHHPNRLGDPLRPPRS